MLKPIFVLASFISLGLLVGVLNPAQAAVVSCSAGFTNDFSVQSGALTNRFNISGTQYGGIVNKNTAGRLFMSTYATAYNYNQPTVETKDRYSDNFTLETTLYPVAYSAGASNFSASSRLEMVDNGGNFENYFGIGLARNTANGYYLYFYSAELQWGEVEQTTHEKVNLPAFTNIAVKLTYYNGMVSAYYKINSTGVFRLLDIYDRYLIENSGVKTFAGRMYLREYQGELPGNPGLRNSYATTTFDNFRVGCLTEAEKPCAMDNSTLSDVYRFYNYRNNSHFYTIDKCEKADVETKYRNTTWRYEQVAYQAYRNQYCAGQNPIYRFYSDKLGRHFYTIDASERDEVIAKHSGTWNKYEGQAFCASKTARAGLLPVYRFWSPVNGGHFYTINESEKNEVIAKRSNFWRYEGVRFYATAK